MCELGCELYVSWGTYESWGVCELGRLIVGVYAVRVRVCENWGVCES